MTQIAAARPAAIGIDLVMPEPDRLSPGRLVELVPGISPDLARQLSTLPSNDALLAQALRGNPVVLGVAGLEIRGPGAREVPRANFAPFGADPLPFVRRFQGALRSVG